MRSLWQHLKRHYEREIEAAERRNEVGLTRAKFRHEALLSRKPDSQPGQIFYNTRCGWQGCNRVFPFGVSDLLRHVESAHLREVKETWCPFRRKSVLPDRPAGQRWSLDDLCLSLERID